MTLDEIYDWQCQMFIYSCYLYEVENQPLLSDEVYDAHCQSLLRRYDQLPEWFRQRVDRERLATGTSSGLEYTVEDIMGAYKWVEDAHARRVSYGLE